MASLKNSHIARLLALTLGLSGAGLLGAEEKPLWEVGALSLIHI